MPLTRACQADDAVRCGSDGGLETAHERVRARAEAPVDLTWAITVGLVVELHHLLHPAHGVSGDPPLDLHDDLGPGVRADDAVRRKALGSTGMRLSSLTWTVVDGPAAGSSPRSM
jgi:hypothetical protein